MIDQLSLLYTHPLCQLKNLHLMSLGHHEKLKEAMVMYNDAIDKLKKVATETRTVPSCTHAQNYASKKAKESQANEYKYYSTLLHPCSPILPLFCHDQLCSFLVTRTHLRIRFFHK